MPSFQVQRYPIDDGATFVRPPTLRGMSADKILVLVNGKRRHRSALVKLSGDGVRGPDLATIPSIALKSVEVLRDGASAMYGSDAIVGVFNFNPRDSAEGGEVGLQTGMCTEGNERGYLLSFNQGLRLGENRFVNVSADLSDNEPTSRGTFFTRGRFSTLETAQVSGLFDQANSALNSGRRIVCQSHGQRQVEEHLGIGGTLNTWVQRRIDSEHQITLDLATVADNAIAHPQPATHRLTSPR